MAPKYLQVRYTTEGDIEIYASEDGKVGKLIGTGAPGIKFDIMLDSKIEKAKRFSPVETGAAPVSVVSGDEDE